MASPAHPSWEDIEAAVQSDTSSPPYDDGQGNGYGQAGPSSHSQRQRRSRIHKDSWRRNDRDLTDLGGERLDDEIQVSKCSECGKVVLARYKEFHRQNCELATAIREGRVSPSILEPDPKKKKRRLSDVSDTPSQADGGNAYASSVSVSPHKKLTKKAAKALEVEERRRQRLEKKARKEREAAENKGRRKKGQPLDVDKQCGVINEETGQPCLRSLTCKTHSMGAKRSVPGRSRSYDELLLDWQKANNPAFLAKLEKKEEARAKALEEKRSKKMEKKRKADARRAAAAAAAAAASSAADGTVLGGGMDGQDASVRKAAALAGEEINTTDNDLYCRGLEDSEVESELLTLLSSISNRSKEQRLAPTPLVVQPSHHGLWTSKARSIMALKQAFGGPAYLSRSFAGANAGGGSSTGGSGPSGGGAGSTPSSATPFSRPPIVAGGGWGSGVFASHS